MPSFITEFFRSRALRRDASPVPTGFAPLSRVRKAAVFVDGSAPDGGRVISAVRAWFDAQGKEVSVYVLNLSDVQFLGEGPLQAAFLHKKDVNWYGRIRRRRRTPQVDRDVDLFISLIPEPHFAVLHAAVSSRAVFKVGRFDTPEQLFDLVVRDRDGQPSSQGEVFSTIAGILEKVQ